MDVPEVSILVPVTILEVFGPASVVVVLVTVPTMDVIVDIT